MSQNALIGDFEVTDLPEAVPDEQDLRVEKQMANYTKTEEFARIQQHCLDRIAFYQTHLPDGKIIGLQVRPDGTDWIAANVIISELKLLIGMYEVATQAVEDANV